MKFLIALFLLIALPVFGAVPAYTSFRGTGGILITSNPPTGNITIDGSGIFTSSGTNATISTSTNGVIVAFASTNINFLAGNNVFLRATNLASATHLGIGINSNLSFFGGGSQMVLGTWGGVFGISNVQSARLSFYNNDLADENWFMPGVLTLNNATLTDIGGIGDVVGIGPTGTLIRTNVTGVGGQSSSMILSNLVGTVGRNVTNIISLSTSNATSKPITNAYANGVLTLFGLEAGANVTVTPNGSNLVIAAIGGGPGGDSGAIQFNQDDTFAGTNRLNYDRTNEILYVAGSVGIGTATPTYTLDVQAAIGSQRIVSTTSANETWLTFINNGAALIGLESGVPGTIVAGSSAYSFLLANQYAYPVQLATDNAVRMTILPTSGNVGINTVSPTNTLDVQGHTSLRSNLFLPNLPTNGSPIAVLAVDAAGKVYETAVPSGGGSSVAPPISSVQFNSNGVQQGSANFTFTNNQVYINNPGAVGSAQLRLENTTQAAAWDLVIDSNPETYFLGIRNGTSYTTVWEPAGNVGIGTTNPGSRLDVVGRVGISPGPSLFATNALDVNGHASIRSNFFLANLPTNGSPIAFLATDAAGAVYETAVPTGGSSSSSDTNAVLTNLVGTVGRNVTNVVSLSTSNATSKPITNAYTGGVLTLFGLEGGSGVTIAPNGSNLVISSSASAVAPPISSVQFNSNGVQQGSATFIFTNNSVGLGGVAVPVATMHVSNAVGGATRLIHAGTNTASGFNVGANGNVGIAALASSVVPLLVSRVGAVGAADPITISLGPSYGTGTGGKNLKLKFYDDGDSSADMGFGIAAGIFELTTAGNSSFVFYKNHATTPVELVRISNAGNVGIGTNGPLLKLDVAGGIRSHSVTASRIAAFHTDKTLTNSRTSSDLFQMFFDMGISNIVAADSGLVIRTNAGVLTISNTVTAAGGTTPPGNSNQIPFLNVAGTAYMYAGYSSITNPGFGFSPSGPSTLNAGIGGLMVFADKVMGLVTIGHPNPAADFSTFSTALTISNRYNGLGDFKNDMVKIDAVLVNASTLQADSTMTRWRVWQAPSGSSTNASTSSNDVAELTIGGRLTLAGGLATNNAAFTITTNNFALDTYYTNMPQRSWVSASIGMTNVLLTEKAWVGLYLDQDGDGTWERTGINVRLQGISALAGVEQLGAFLQPSARFIFTNLGTVANSSIEPNSSQWVKQ